MLLEGDDLALLAAGVLRPRRARAREARAAVKGVDSARRAWSALDRAGLVPAHWVGGRDRRFIRDPLEWRIPGDRDHAATPPSIAACVAFASDPDGAAAAEALASVVAARLAPWALGLPRPRRGALGHVFREFMGRQPPPPVHACPRILWRCASPRAWKPYHDYALRPREALHLAGCGTGFGLTRWRPWCLPAALRRRVGLCVARLVEAQVDGARAWDEAVTLDRIVPPDSAWLRSVLLKFPPALVGQRFSGLADPFAPLMALWATGYAIEAIGEHTVTLLAPECA
jgi:hypothetical protein